MQPVKNVNNAHVEKFYLREKNVVKKRGMTNFDIKEWALSTKWVIMFSSRVQRGDPEILLGYLA